MIPDNYCMYINVNKRINDMVQRTLNAEVEKRCAGETGS